MGDILDLLGRGFGCVCGGRDWCSAIVLRRWVDSKRVVLRYRWEEWEYWRSVGAKVGSRFDVVVDSPEFGVSGSVEFDGEKFVVVGRDIVLPDSVVKMLENVVSGFKLCSGDLEFVLDWASRLYGVLIRLYMEFSKSGVEEVSIRCGPCSVWYGWSDADNDWIVLLMCSWGRKRFRFSVGAESGEFMIYDSDNKIVVDFEGGEIEIEFRGDDAGTFYKSVAGLLRGKKGDVFRCVAEGLRRAALSSLFP